MTVQKTTLLISALASWCAQAIYTVSPIDLIPDIIPILGLADDLIGFLLVLSFTAYTVYRISTKPRPHKDTDSVSRSAGTSQATNATLLEYEPLTLDEIKAL